jgi:hypothetical protein
VALPQNQARISDHHQQNKQQQQQQQQQQHHMGIINSSNSTIGASNTELKHNNQTQ